MTLKNAKKRKSLSSDSKSASSKERKTCMSPVKKSLKNGQDGRGCSLLTKLIDSGVVADHELVFYIRKKDKSVMKEGVLTREGVLCTCCSGIFLLSRFEVHAGSGLHRPSANMFLKDGRSLMQCQQAIEAKEAQIKTSKCSRADNCLSIQSKALQASPNNDRNDNTCQMCGDGGRLILCDTCPSAFHQDCLGLDVVPDGEWHCPRCRCGACGESILKYGIQTSGWIATPAAYLQFSSNDHLEGAPSPFYDDKCLREDDARVSAYPRLDDTEGLTAKKELVVVSCAHCQVSYHFDCVKRRPQHQCGGLWFCTKHCNLIFDGLRNHLGHPFPLDRGLSWMLVRSFKEDSAATRPSSGHQSFERKLFEAYEVMQECFDPIIDPETGVDLLAQTLFNKKAELRRLDCSGFYAMLLLKGDQIVSVATFRVHGQLLAEMPFIATTLKYRNQGMCRAVMKALESLLIDLGIYKLVLPSVAELLETWMGSFEFQVMMSQERHQVSHIGILPFVGTTLLHKSLLKLEPAHVQETAPETVESKTKPGFLRIKLKLNAASKPAKSFEPISCH